MNKRRIYKGLLCLVVSMFTYLGSEAQCTLSASSSGGNTSYTQLYVLVDASGDIVAVNPSGTFTSVPSGNYQIHALNYDPTNIPNPLPSALIGSPVTGVGSTAQGCFNSDFFTDVVNRSCTSSGTCVSASTVCQGDDFIANSPGSTSGYTQVYVLTNPDGTYVSSIMTSGAATFSTSALVDGNTYQVHALNYDPGNAPSPLPSGLAVGQSINDVGSVTSGCFNSDFATDFICFTLTCPSPCTPVVICQGDDFVANSPGSTAGYTQVYVLANSDGTYVSSITTSGAATFNTSALVDGNTYQVYALNYDPANAPVPLPSGLAVGQSINDVGSVTSGCFNSDFATDFICFQLNCPCTAPLGFLRK